MLTESFAVATADPEKPTNKTAAGIHFHELQPSPAVRSTFKKSSVNPNCLAISPTHVFAAQAEKAIVHVYNRERNNQEAVVPFPEKIRSLVIAGEQNGGGIVIIGMESGRIVLWEVIAHYIPINRLHSQEKVALHWKTSLHTTASFTRCNLPCCRRDFQFHSVRLN